MLKVEKAALRQRDEPHRLFTGATHADARMSAFRSRMPLFGCEEGFLLSDGTFAHRVRAMEVAREAGQLLGTYGDSEVLFSYMLK